MSTPSRRHLLGAALAAPLLTGSWRLWAAPAAAGDARLLVVFLRGAYDGLSALVPYAEPFYYESRPTLALARPDPAASDASVRLDGRWGLHPALNDSLMPLWSAGALAFVPFAGTAFVSRSHFQAQDWIEFGQPIGGRPDGSSGFMNRLLGEIGGHGTRAVALTQSLPAALRGPLPVANAPVTGPRWRHSEVEYEDLLVAMYADHPHAALVREGMGLKHEIASELREEMQAASRNSLPASGFALEAGRIGRLLRERRDYALGFVDVGGWDTHAAQGAARGVLATRLAALGAGLAGFAEGLGQAEWNRTVVVVISEFGRTFRENGSRGTDHGHGTAMWVLGGQVRGGAVRGEQSGLRAADLHQGRDVPVLNEYRATLSGIMGRMYGLSAAKTSRVFPGVDSSDLVLI